VVTTITGATQLALTGTAQLPFVHTKLALPVVGATPSVAVAKMPDAVAGVAPVQLFAPTIQLKDWLVQAMGAGGVAHVLAVVIQAPLLATPLVVVTVRLWVIEPVCPVGHARVCVWVVVTTTGGFTTKLQTTTGAAAKLALPT